MKVDGCDLVGKENSMVWKVKWATVGMKSLSRKRQRDLVYKRSLGLNRCPSYS